MPDPQENKTPERYWPQDALGNEVRRGQLVSLRVPETMIVARVADVIEAGFSGDGKDRMELQGAVVLTVQIPYNALRPAIGQLLSLKEPDTSRIHRV